MTSRDVRPLGMDAKAHIWNQIDSLDTSWVIEALSKAADTAGKKQTVTLLKGCDLFQTIRLQAAEAKLEHMRVLARYDIQHQQADIARRKAESDAAVTNAKKRLGRAISNSEILPQDWPNGRGSSAPAKPPYLEPEQ